MPDKQKKNDYAYFNLVGGPHHGMRVRMYAPWDNIKFDDGTIYEINKAIKKGEWVYVHSTDHPSDQ